MTKWIEIKTAILKGIGLWPTSYLLRWSPNFKNPFQFDLLEVMKCETDGEIWTRNMAQSPRAVLHAGHFMKNPKIYSFLDLLKVQLRIVQ